LWWRGCGGGQPEAARRRGCGVVVAPLRPCWIQRGVGAEAGLRRGGGGAMAGSGGAAPALLDVLSALVPL
jgi:hypothetical protein